jgi:uncharacterized protein
MQHNKKIFNSIFILIFFSIFLFFLFSSGPNAVKKIKSVQIAGQSVLVDTASTPLELERGLSGRKNLENNKGLLFIFENSDKHSFWMKDMLFPIDIIWINENMQVTYIKENARPELFPEIYKPNENAKYVLEVMAGFVDKHNLQIGDKVLFTY